MSAALRWEIQPIVRALGEVRRIQRDGATVWVSALLPVIVFRTGVGQKRAAAATRAVLDAYPVRAVINSGCAGGLIPGVGRGAVVIPESIYDSARAISYAAHPKWVQRLCRATQLAGLSAHPGSFHSTDAALTTAESKRAAHEVSGAAAVEMEGAAVASVALERGIDFAAVRGILDDASTPIPSFRRGDDTDGLIARFKLNLRFVTLPAHLPPLLSLSLGVREVRTALHSVFHSLFEPSDELTKWFETER